MVYENDNNSKVNERNELRVESGEKMRKRENALNRKGIEK